MALIDSTVLFIKERFPNFASQVWRKCRFSQYETHTTLIMSRASSDLIKAPFWEINIYNNNPMCTVVS